MLPEQELLDAINILVNKAASETTRIYTGRVIGIGENNTCTMKVNGNSYDNIIYYGDAPTIEKMYRVFVPNNNMSLAFIFTMQSSSGGSSGGTTNYNDLTNKPSINNITLSGNKTLSQIGAVALAGATMTGALVAQNNANYTTAQVRNVIMSPNAPTDSDGNNGDVWIQYTE